MVLCSVQHVLRYVWYATVVLQYSSACYMLQRTTVRYGRGMYLPIFRRRIARGALYRTEKLTKNNNISTRTTPWLMGIQRTVL